jgi:hypothetical protein
MSTTAGRVVVFAAVALISGVVGALVTRQGSSAQPAASITQTQGGPGFGGPNGGGGGFGRFGGGPRFGGGNDVAIAAQTIGVDQSQLLTALQSGQSIAQVASAHGVSAQKVIDAIVGARKATLADAVKAGRLTQAQADELVANLTQRVTQLVNDSGFAGGPAPGSAPGGSAGQPSTTTHTV